MTWYKMIWHDITIYFLMTSNITAGPPYGHINLRPKDLVLIRNCLTLMDWYGFLWISMDFYSIQSMILDFLSMMLYYFVPQFLTAVDGFCPHNSTSCQPSDVWVADKKLLTRFRRFTAVTAERRKAGAVECSGVPDLMQKSLRGVIFSDFDFFSWENCWIMLNP